MNPAREEMCLFSNGERNLEISEFQNSSVRFIANRSKLNSFNWPEAVLSDPY